MRPNGFREAPQFRVFVMLIILSRDLRVNPRSLFACRMMRGQDETSPVRLGEGWGPVGSCLLQAALWPLCP